MASARARIRQCDSVGGQSRALAGWASTAAVAAQGTVVQQVSQTRRYSFAAVSSRSVAAR
jgi:hypothetical protein